MPNPREKRRSDDERGVASPDVESRNVDDLERPDDLDDGSEDGGRGLNALPDLMRRALSIGFSGFFMTEEAVRRALGDTLPKDWVDFAVDQSERTRTEFLDRLSFELGQAMERLDFAAVLSDLLDGKTLEVKAEIKLSDAEGRRTRGRKPQLRVKTANLGDDGDDSA